MFVQTVLCTNILTYELFHKTMFHPINPWGWQEPHIDLYFNWLTEWKII